MTNIRPPGTPSPTETAPQTPAPAPQARQEHKAQDTLGTTTQGPREEAPAHAVPGLHVPVPPNLRPIRTHAQPPAGEPGTSDSDGVWSSPFSDLEKTPSPGQADAVAQGILGLAARRDDTQSSPQGMWATPTELFDTRGLSAGGQRTVAKLEQIDIHLGLLASLLNVDID